MLTNYRVLVIGNNVVKIGLGNKADGKKYQQYKGQEFLYGWFSPQRILQLVSRKSKRKTQSKANALLLSNDVAFACLCLYNLEEIGHNTFVFVKSMRFAVIRNGAQLCTVLPFFFIFGS